MNTAHGDAPTANELPPSEKRLCAHCVGEEFLKALIAKEGEEIDCSYCKGQSRTISILDLADRVESAFDTYYERTPTEPDGLESSLQSDPESEYEWHRRGDNVLLAICEGASISEEVGKDVLSVLESRHYDHEAANFGQECPFDKKSCYDRIEPEYGDVIERWTKFENSLKTEARYFSRSCQETLDDIFAGLSGLETRSGTPVVVSAGPNGNIQSIYRARVFAGDDVRLCEAIKYPWKHLGPPPTVAASAGRMNARGISVFYGAMDECTALAEIRPPVGSKVAIAKFSIERSLRLLDVEGLRSVVLHGSIFDPEHIRRIERARFLDFLSHSFSKPVMPNEESLEYVMTQAVADYLATEAKLDGVVYPAVQVGGTVKNIVLFHHASRVSEFQLPAGTVLEAYSEHQDSDGITTEYQVFESVPVQKPDRRASQSGLAHADSDFACSMPTDSRPLTLSIDLGCISVRHIRAVHFESDPPYPVARHRSERDTAEDRYSPIPNPRKHD